MDHTRHQDIYDASSCSITLIGCGGIGALTALILAKMGVGYLTLFDNDTVDDVNLSTQFHRIESVGFMKATTLRDTIRMFADDTEVEVYNERVSPLTHLYGHIIISAVDSIRARKDIWEAVKNSNAQWYIDSRMASEEYRQYAMPLEPGWTWYENLLASEDDATAVQETCTAKATIFTASIAAGHLGNAVKGILVGEHPAKILTHNIRREVLFTL